MMGAQYESSLFSSSLSEIFSRKLRLSSNIASYGHSVDTVASHYEEEENFESLEEIEAQTIGNLLPDDDDLFSGVTDGLDYTIHHSGGDDMDDLDIFSSVGGMDLGYDGYSAAQKKSEIFTQFSNGDLGACNRSVSEDHPNGEHPSRTLFVGNINSNVEDSELKALFEQYGDIHSIYTACKHHGYVMISYYDIRAAQNAMNSLQNKLMRHRKLDIHFLIPKDNPSEKEMNQGTLVMFNLDSSVSNDELRQIFGVYGEIKELRETPHKIHQKLVEFYDNRATEAAFRALDGRDIAGKQMKLEFRCPGDSRKCLANQFPQELEQDERVSYLQQNSPLNKPTNEYSGAFAHGSTSSSSRDNSLLLGVRGAIKAPPLEPAFHLGISSSVPNSLPSLMRMESIGNQFGLAESSHLQEIITSRQFCSNGHSSGFTEAVFGYASSGSCPLPGHQYAWNNSYRSQPPGMMWPNSPSMVNGIGNACSPTRLHGLPRAPSHIVNTILPIGNNHVGSALTVDPSLWERRHSYVAESSGFHPGSLGSMRISNNSLHSGGFAPHNLFPCIGGHCMDMPIPPKNLGFQSHHQRPMIFAGRGQMIPMMNSFDPPSERSRSRRNEGAVNQADKKQYELDIECILRGEDNRTTLMIKNIPNKYTSKMLLAAIDERHMGTYNFIYLPIDFKNKCNVGYAFINMTDPSQIIPFYQSFNGKKWEKFNSEKVASLAYARIQGKAALIAHFQNSSLMNEDKRCRPILFNTAGPNAGDQLPFPMGVNIRTRPGKAPTVIHEENHPPNGEYLSNGQTPSGSAKDSD